MADVHVKGLAELQKMLNTLAPKMEKNIMRGALRAGANVIKEEAKQNINSISGQLAKGLKVSTSGKGGEVIASVKAKGPHGYIANWVEFGTKPHTITAEEGSLLLDATFAGSVDHPGASPHPFMRNSLDAKSGAAVVAVGEYIKKRLATKEGINTSDITIEAEE